MSAAQIEQILFYLLKTVERDGHGHGIGIDREGGQVNADRLWSRLRGVAGFYASHDPPSWYETDLHPAMCKPLLSICGYEADGKVAQENMPIELAAVPLLAVFRKNGELPDLSQLVDDEKQPMALRWVSVMAVSRAGEDVVVEKVLALLKKEKRLEGRLTGLLFLSYLDPSPKLDQTLVEALDDANQHIRTAALYSLDAHRSPAALPKLEKLLLADEKKPVRSNRQLLNVIGKLGTAQAKKCLAEYLERALMRNDQRREVADALWAFESAVGRRWIEAGAHDEAYYRAKAQLAIEWWKKQ